MTYYKVTMDSIYANEQNSMNKDFKKHQPLNIDLWKWDDILVVPLQKFH